MIPSSVNAPDLTFSRKNRTMLSILSTLVSVETKIVIGLPGVCGCAQKSVFNEKAAGCVVLADCGASVLLLLKKLPRCAISQTPRENSNGPHQNSMSSARGDGWTDRRRTRFLAALDAVPIIPNPLGTTVLASFSMLSEAQRFVSSYAKYFA